MINIENLIARLNELATQPPDETTLEEVISLMEEGIAQPGGLDILVARYANRPDPLLLRPLTFFAAQSISKKGPEAGAAAALRLLDQLHCDDESTRSNLASALHLLAMHHALPEQAPPQLAEFLDQGLRNGQALRDAVIPATATILASGVRFTDSERIQLRTALQALQDQEPELVAIALRALR